jgi:hypothetical protein
MGRTKCNLGQTPKGSKKFGSAHSVGGKHPKRSEEYLYVIMHLKVTAIDFAKKALQEMIYSYNELMGLREEAIT